VEECYEGRDELSSQEQHLRIDKIFQEKEGY